MKIAPYRGKCLGSLLFLAIFVLASCSGGDGGGVGVGGGVAANSAISGQVTSNGSGLSGATVTLSGASSATTITDANGNYAFTGLANGSYTATPSKAGYTFNPASIAQTVNGADITDANCTATPVQAATYSISGQVTSNGSGLSGVGVALSGASSATAITDANGNYAFTGLFNGSYTVTPSKAVFTFNPASSSQTVSGANMPGVDFIATPAQAATYSISGQVTSNGSGLSGVAVALSGADSATAITGASGNYAFTGLANGNYTVTPSKAGFSFSPASSPQTVGSPIYPGRQFHRHGSASSHLQHLRPSHIQRLWPIRGYCGIERSKLRDDHNRR